MAKMLKEKDRLSSKQNTEAFKKSKNINMDFTADVVIHSEEGNGFYFGVPSQIIREDYPFDECSYSINLLWSKREKQMGVEPKSGFPNYPSYAEYKTYFNHMRFQEGLYLEFRNIWQEDVAIYIFSNDKDIDNKDNMIRIAKLWEKQYE